MSEPPVAPGGYELELHAGRGQVIAARLRAAAHAGRIRVARLRRWLGTPQGRRAATRTAQGLALLGLALGAGQFLRRWAATARARGAALVGAYRRVAGAMGEAGRRIRFALSLRWLAALADWGTHRVHAPGHIHCPDCQTRIRGDAHVCFRCGNRELPGAQVPPARRAGRRMLRVLLLRSQRRCPDCRRTVHADARVCRSCGCRLS